MGQASEGIFTTIKVLFCETVLISLHCSRDFQNSGNTYVRIASGILVCDFCSDGPYAMPHNLKVLSRESVLVSNL